MVLGDYDKYQDVFCVVDTSTYQTVKVINLKALSGKSTNSYYIIIKLYMNLRD